MDKGPSPSQDLQLSSPMAETDSEGAQSSIATEVDQSQAPRGEGGTQSRAAELLRLVGSKLRPSRHNLALTPPPEVSSSGIPWAPPAHPATCDWLRTECPQCLPAEAVNAVHTPQPALSRPGSRCKPCTSSRGPGGGVRQTDTLSRTDCLTERMRIPAEALRARFFESDPLASVPKASPRPPTDAVFPDSAFPFGSSCARLPGGQVAETKIEDTHPQCVAQKYFLLQAAAFPAVAGLGAHLGASLLAPLPRTACEGQASSVYAFSPNPQSVALLPSPASANDAAVAPPQGNGSRMPEAAQLHAHQRQLPQAPDNEAVFTVSFRMEQTAKACGDGAAAQAPLPSPTFIQGEALPPHPQFRLCIADYAAPTHPTRPCTDSATLNPPENLQAPDPLRSAKNDRSATPQAPETHSQNDESTAARADLARLDSEDAPPQSTPKERLSPRASDGRGARTGHSESKDPHSGRPSALQRQKEGASGDQTASLRACGRQLEGAHSSRKSEATPREAQSGAEAGPPQNAHLEVPLQLLRRILDQQAEQLSLLRLWERESSGCPPDNGRALRRNASQEQGELRAVAGPAARLSPAESHDAGWTGDIPKPRNLPGERRAAERLPTAWSTAEDLVLLLGNGREGRANIQWPRETPSSTREASRQVETSSERHQKHHATQQSACAGHDRSREHVQEGRGLREARCCDQRADDAQAAPGERGGCPLTQENLRYLSNPSSYVIRTDSSRRERRSPDSGTAEACLMSTRCANSYASEQRNEARCAEFACASERRETARRPSGSRSEGRGEPPRAVTHGPPPTAGCSNAAEFPAIPSHSSPRLYHHLQGAGTARRCRKSRREHAHFPQTHQLGRDARPGLPDRGGVAFPQQGLEPETAVWRRSPRQRRPASRDDARRPAAERLPLPRCAFSMGRDSPCGTDPTDDACGRGEAYTSMDQRELESPSREDLGARDIPPDTQDRRARDEGSRLSLVAPTSIPHCRRFVESGGMQFSPVEAHACGASLHTVAEMSRGVGTCGHSSRRAIGSIPSGSLCWRHVAALHAHKLPCQCSHTESAPCPGGAVSACFADAIPASPTPENSISFSAGEVNGGGDFVGSCRSQAGWRGAAQQIEGTEAVLARKMEEVELELRHHLHRYVQQQRLESELQLRQWRHARQGNSFPQDESRAPCRVTSGLGNPIFCGSCLAGRNVVAEGGCCRSQQKDCRHRAKVCGGGFKGTEEDDPRGGDAKCSWGSPFTRMIQKEFWCTRYRQASVQTDRRSRSSTSSPPRGGFKPSPSARETDDRLRKGRRRTHRHNRDIRPHSSPKHRQRRSLTEQQRILLLRVLADFPPPSHSETSTHSLSTRSESSERSCSSHRSQSPRTQLHLPQQPEVESEQLLPAAQQPTATAHTASISSRSVRHRQSLKHPTDTSGLVHEADPLAAPDQRAAVAAAGRATPAASGRQDMWETSANACQTENASLCAPGASHFRRKPTRKNAVATGTTSRLLATAGRCVLRREGTLEKKREMQSPAAAYQRRSEVRRRLSIERISYGKENSARRPPGCRVGPRLRAAAPTRDTASGIEDNSKAPLRRNEKEDAGHAREQHSALQKTAASTAGNSSERRVAAEASEAQTPYIQRPDNRAPPKQNVRLPAAFFSGGRCSLPGRCARQTPSSASQVAHVEQRSDAGGRSERSSGPKTRERALEREELRKLPAGLACIPRPSTTR
ncbi:hypothetical protein BESB_071860 [Besnoitia besnoiti]|uniref:Uncharacterized protein n=1 Tax=Besnoitia besnoiti TaxID=94643 RepID=A0A2A9MA07_BESBE|nr:uncharacterized protein BESB_071860 [Besnoitia besnoiti]PFH34034.1 hypothetical protein BESB_071860 [Besnoitia besnoiti]